MGNDLDKKFKIFVIVALVALAGLAATATFIAFRVMATSNEVASGSTKSVNREDLVVMSLSDAITSNIQSDKNNYHMIRVQVAFEVDGKSKEYKTFSEGFSSQEAIIRDAIIRVLRQQTYEMVMREDAQDKVGEQIKTALQELLGTKIIEGVVFADFFVQ